MPRGIYKRKPKQQILFTDTTRLDLCENLSEDLHIYKPRYVGEPIVVRTGPYMGRGTTVRAALDDLARHQ